MENNKGVRYVESLQHENGGAITERSGISEQSGVAEQAEKAELGKQAGTKDQGGSTQQAGIMEQTIINEQTVKQIIKEGSRETPSFERKDKLLLAGAFSTGILFVWLFYGKYPGISIPIYVAAFYALLLVYTRPMLAKEARFGWFLSIPVIMISLTFLLFDNQILMVLNLLALPLLVLLQTLLITGVNSSKWHSPAIIIDLVYGVFVRCIVHTLLPFKILSPMLRLKSNKGQAKPVGMKVLTGLIISVPLLTILLLLLASADMVFGRLVEKLPAFFEAINIDEFIGKVFVALIVFFISFSYIWSIGHGERSADNAAGSVLQGTSGQKRRWDPVTMITVTAAVDVLYIIFVIIQFAYLFGRSGLPEGFTYAEYARSGFFELIFVTLLNMALLACSLTFTKKGVAGVDIAYRIMNTIVTGCTFVMLISAHYRMSMYENAYGFTFLRIMTHAFMVFLFVLFVITLVRVWFDRVPLLKPYIVASLIAFTVINYMNADMMILKNNLKRYYDTGKIDMSYLRTLSSDVTGDLITLTGDDNVEVAQKAVDIIKERKDRLSRNNCWQSFSLPRYKARRLLDKVR